MSCSSLKGGVHHLRKSHKSMRMRMHPQTVKKEDKKKYRQKYGRTALTRNNVYALRSSFYNQNLATAQSAMSNQTRKTVRPRKLAAIRHMTVINVGARKRKAARRESLRQEAIERRAQEKINEEAKKQAASMRSVHQKTQRAQRAQRREQISQQLTGIRSRMGLSHGRRSTMTMHALKTEIDDIFAELAGQSSGAASASSSAMNADMEALHALGAEVKAMDAMQNDD
jgi:hypothetical protein